jgi:hypothetical protein
MSYALEPVQTLSLYFPNAQLEQFLQTLCKPLVAPVLSTHLPPDMYSPILHALQGLQSLLLLSNVSPLHLHKPKNGM